MAVDAYLRYPNIRGETIVFVAENDVWVTGRDERRAHRVSADHVPVVSPRLSPDGRHVAWSARRYRANEVYVAPVDGGVSAQLTFWGQERTWVRGWLSDEEILVVSTTGEADRPRCFAHAVPVDGGPSRWLPYGWVSDLALGPEGGVLLQSPDMSEPAWRKRYRGGTAAQLWLDLTGDGTFKRIFADLTSSLVSPLWTKLPDGRQRIGFLSDHGNRCQVFSATVGRRAPSTSALIAHTDHDYYARHATTDGEQVVYVSGGSLFVLDSLEADAEPRRVEVRLGGARVGLQQKPLTIKAGRQEDMSEPWVGAVSDISPDHTGRASVVEVRGTIHWLTHRDGPVRALADSPGVRRRLPTVLGDTGRVVWVTDRDGDDAIEVGATGGEPQTLVSAGKVGRVLEMAASPDGRRLAVAAHDGRLLILDVPEGELTRSARVRVVDTTTQGDMDGLAFSPDSSWLAWSAPGPMPLRQIRMVEVGRARATAFDVTPLRFADTEPTFTTDGKHLAFLSVRSFDPVYDAFTFDLSFPNGCRPYLVPLAASTPSPFDPEPGGRAPVPLGAPPASAAGSAVEPQDHVETRVDPPGLDQRIVPTPVAGARYSGLRSVHGGLVWLRQPSLGELGDDLPRLGEEPPRATLEHLDLVTGKKQVLVDAVDAVYVSGDGLRLVVRDKDALRVVPASEKVEKDDDPRVIEVDLDRLRPRSTPAAEWTQMYHEAWRLMRDNFWREDMGGVDWAAARDRYAPMLDRIASHDDLVDLIWEMHGELESSHAYVMPPLPADRPGTHQGLLGADLSFEDGAWRVRRVVPGESSEPRARSPLTAPGVVVGVGDEIVAVDGRPTSRTQSPGSLLVGTADKPVELTIVPAGGDEARAVVVVPLADEFPLRYQDLVNDRRAYVHAQTDGRIGYLHVPDMMSGGWAQVHRDLRVEVTREGLILDVRGNRGGHTSQLIVEKVARKVIGWDLNRGYEPVSYPEEARRGPMVCLTDMYAGSDGDIVTAAIKALGLGPVVGTRTWGGVIGIDGRYKLVDGTTVTQPRFSFWFEQFGWGVENYGVDPDIEVPAAPQDRVAGDDVQLDRALRLVQQQLAKAPASTPPGLPPLT